MESQPQNPEFRINPGNFQQCRDHALLKKNNGSPWKIIVQACPGKVWLGELTVPP